MTRREAREREARLARERGEIVDPPSGQIPVSYPLSGPIPIAGAGSDGGRQGEGETSEWDGAHPVTSPISFESVHTASIPVISTPTELQTAQGGRRIADGYADDGNDSSGESELENAFWGNLGDASENADGNGDQRPTRPNTWSSLDYPTDGKPDKPKKKRRWLITTIVLVVVLGLIGAGGVYVWNSFQPEVRKLLALNEPNDYTGSGTSPVTITIKDGDNGSDIATTLQKAGVVMTSDAFYTLLLHTKPDPVFQPGVYQLKKHMSAKSALAALQDPKNKLARTLTIPEGDTEADILPALAKTTGVPLQDLQAAAANPADFGVPSQAKNLDGFLFPATYTFDPGVDAKTVIKTLVDRAFKAFDADGVPKDKVWNTVVLASVVQKEAGSTEDMGKVARVFQNRLDQGMALQSDATVAYGAGVKTVFTTDAQRADAGNLYNTYAHEGLPVGPISNPGDDALKAAMNPTPGGWLYFVTVDLKDGTTVFSNTEDEHNKAVQQLQDWCNASAANDAYCQ
ncbi:endolytic transglycosylase MltG [Planctomonas sp. JC2975]|uniref:endolytic transglycosylase MltG n=1 Tax=Planctomonas sp. JC2975 TaxID=2729626 RepID=UPI001473B568|nr:endolytic transglycosylase MltG [Planctomonas sp. JC2975]NNC10600.1 endolytic transglycosylase MltG [Planctomonas sp. JC2975]